MPTARSMQTEWPDPLTPLQCFPIAEPFRRAPSNGDPRAFCEVAAKLAARHYGIPLADITARTRRSRQASRARHVAIYIAHVALGLRLDVIAGNFQRSRRAVDYACHKIEDARDNPAFDAALADLEFHARFHLGLEGQAA